MNENAEKVQKKLEEVDDLISTFGTQAEKLISTENRFRTAVKTFDDKTKEIIDMINNYLGNAGKWYKESKEWYSQTTSEVGDLVYDFGESLEAFKTIFNEENFKEICTKISELSKILNDCQALKNEIVGMGEIVIEEVNKKIESEMLLLREQQKNDRMFFEEKFKELFALLQKRDD